MKSGLFSLKTKDWIKGLILAVVVPVLLAVEQSLTEGTLTFNWKQLGMTAAASLVAYLAKNFLTNDTAEAVKTIENAGGGVIENQKPI
jgi:hypothetical protein